jgi:hypothetical protein
MIVEPATAISLVFAAMALAGLALARRARRSDRWMAPDLAAQLRWSRGTFRSSERGGEGERAGWRIRISGESSEESDARATSGLRVELLPRGEWPDALWDPPPDPTELAIEHEVARLVTFDRPTLGAVEALRRGVERVATLRNVDSRIVGGRLVAVFPGHVTPTRTMLDKQIDLLVRLASVLDRRGRPPARCIADGIAGASAVERRRRLQVLLAAFPGEDASQEAFRAALLDEDATLRITGASAIGAEARGVLEEIALDAARPASLRQEAFSAWVATRPQGDEARRVLERLLAEPIARQRLAALRAALELQVSCSPGAVMAHEESSDEEALIVARLLSGHPGRRSEDHLLVLLATGAPEVQQAALRALRDVGTAECVGHVLPLAQAMLPSGVRSEARETLLAVRDRLGESGRLSTPPPANGSLSTAAGGAEPSS